MELLVEARAIASTCWKDLLVFFRYPLRTLSLVVEPFLFFVPFIIFGAMFAQDGSAAGLAAFVGVADYASFVVTGALFWNFVSAIFWGIGLSLREEMVQGTLELAWTTPARRFSLLLGRTVAHLITTIITTGLMGLGFTLLFGYRWLGGNLPLAMTTLLLSLVTLYGLGFVFAGVVLWLKEPYAIANVSRIVLGLLCGWLYPITVLPEWLQPLSLALPLTYAIDLLRAALLGTRTLLPLSWELVILGFSAALCPAVGYLLFRWLERHSRTSGTLGQY